MQLDLQIDACSVPNFKFYVYFDLPTTLIVKMLCDDADSEKKKKNCSQID